MPETYKAAWSKRLSFNHVSVDLFPPRPPVHAKDLRTYTTSRFPDSFSWVLCGLRYLLSQPGRALLLPCYPRSCLAMIERLSSKHPQDLLIFPFYSRLRRAFLNLEKKMLLFSDPSTSTEFEIEGLDLDLDVQTELALQHDWGPEERKSRGNSHTEKSSGNSQCPAPYRRESLSLSWTGHLALRQGFCKTLEENKELNWTGVQPSASILPTHPSRRCLAVFRDIWGDHN